jgi:hypothetical protein
MNSSWRIGGWENVKLEFAWTPCKHVGKGKMLLPAPLLQSWIEGSLQFLTLLVVRYMLIIVIRFRLIPTFGWSTLCQFGNNTSEINKIGCPKL